MPELKKLTMDCPSCDEFFILVYKTGQPESCPFCGSSISDEVDEPEENLIDEIIEDDYSVDTYEEEDSYEN